MINPHSYRHDTRPRARPGIKHYTYTYNVSFRLISSQLQRQPQQRCKIRHPEARNRIPRLRRVPARVGDDAPTYNRETGLAIDAITADAPAGCDVRKAYVGDCVY